MSVRLLSKQRQAEVIRNMIQEFQDRKYYGKITLSFSNGDITSLRTEESMNVELLASKYSRATRFVVKAVSPDFKQDEKTQENIEKNDEFQQKTEEIHENEKNSSFSESMECDIEPPLGGAVGSL